MDVSELIQETLDAALGDLGIQTYEGRRQIQIFSKYRPRK